MKDPENKDCMEDIIGTIWCLSWSIGPSDWSIVHMVSS